ncbi:hypothetical protein Pcinc_019380 [Petrolisthes cinctipes]|uniref:Uncharacterized protein n=1 Tax=Petrolisthes cinctipes TaxID=88211 RepID=A0AAE1FL92_PETCI|nr:hypothetical protein Pcinc_019380 [Petrolisthes cinctipes]
MDKIGRVGFWWCVSGVAASFLHLLNLSSFLVTFTSLALLSCTVCFLLASLTVETVGKTVLITGCDSGFGYALALHLDALGMGVVACCLDAEGDGGQQLREKGSSRLHVLQLDITSGSQLTQALDKVKEILGPHGVLWGLVNNAAITTYGAVEWVTMDTYRKVCDVNLFGSINVTKIFLPLIRKAKGRVVTMGSARGRIASPLGSVYEVTKFALEAFNDCLRMEMKPFGVKVAMIEPGNFTAGTKIFTEAIVQRYGEQMWEAMDDEVKETYGKHFYDNNLLKQTKISKSGNPDVSQVLVVLTEALTHVYPQARYNPMDFKLYFIMFVATHFPEWIADFVFDQLVVKQTW